MRKLTLTLAAACCFALLIAQAQAIAAGPQPEPPYDPGVSIIQPIDAVERAADTFEDGARDLSIVWVSPEEERSRQIAVAYLRQGGQYERCALYYLNRASDTLSLMRNSKASSSLIAEFDSYRGAAVQCTGVALNRAANAYYLPSSTVRYRSAPSFSRALEAYRKTCEFRNESVWDLVYGGNDTPWWYSASWFW